MGVESAWVWDLKVRGCGRGKCLGMGAESAWHVLGGGGLEDVARNVRGVEQQGLGRGFLAAKTGFLVAFHAARPQHPVQST